MTSQQRTLADMASHRDASATPIIVGVARSAEAGRATSRLQAFGSNCLHLITESRFAPPLLASCLVVALLVISESTNAAAQDKAPQQATPDNAPATPAATEPKAPAATEPKAPAATQAAQPDPVQPDLERTEKLTRWKAQGWGLIQQFCIDCHNDNLQEAEINLAPFADAAHAEANPELWNRVLQMVRFGAMPPDDADLPTEAQRRDLAKSLDEAIYAATCDLRPRSGRVTARRLNRVEYNNSIRDIFGMDLNLTSDFPSDEVGGGFDNNADVLAMPPMLFEKYLDAAEKVASTVLLDADSLKKESIELGGERIAIHGDGYTESFYGRLFPKESFAWVEFELATAGVYRVRVSGAAAHEWKALPTPPPAPQPEAKADTPAKDSEKEPAKEEPKREPIEQAIAIYDATGKPLHFEKFKYSDSGGDTTNFEHEFPAGVNRLVVATLDQTPEKLADLPTFPGISRLDDTTLKAGREQFEKSLEISRDIPRESLAFLLRRIQVDGPRDFPKEMLPPSQSQIVVRAASRRGDEYTAVEESAQACLKPLIRRVFRGPVDDDTLVRYTALVKAATDRGASFHRGLQDAIAAMLVSPRFLFRVELPADDAKPDELGEYRLTDLQLASRLSYFLWSSTPDDEILKLATDGKLSDPKVLQAQVDRMLNDPKSQSLSQQFAAQWLGLRNLQGMPRDDSKFPDYNEELVASMIAETQRLFMHVLKTNRPVGELLDADYTFVDPRLAKLYGIPEPPQDQRDPEGFARVSLADAPRRGILTHASVLTLTSYPTRTSPVQRGKWILESVLGTPAPEPPPNVPELPAGGEDTSKLSLREQMVIHRENPSCSSCHRVMDQLGFGFEDFDAIGRFRGGEGVDASGELPGRRTFNGGRDLAEILRKTEAQRFASTVSEKMLAFATGRELTPTDRCVIEQIVGNTQSADYPLADLVKQVVASRPFQYFEAEPGANHEPK